LTKLVLPAVTAIIYNMQNTTVIVVVAASSSSRCFTGVKHLPYYC